MKNKNYHEDYFQKKSHNDYESLVEEIFRFPKYVQSDTLKHVMKIHLEREMKRRDIVIFAENIFRFIMLFTGVYFMGWIISGLFLSEAYYLLDVLFTGSGLRVLQALIEVIPASWFAWTLISLSVYFYLSGDINQKRRNHESEIL